MLGEKLVCSSLGKTIFPFSAFLIYLHPLYRVETSCFFLVYFDMSVVLAHLRFGQSFGETLCVDSDITGSHSSAANSLIL